MNQLQQRTFTQAVALYKEGQANEAEKLISPLLKQLPDSPQLWAIYAKVTANPVKRRKALQKVLQLRPNDSWATTQLASLPASSFGKLKRIGLVVAGVVLLLIAGIWFVNRDDTPNLKDEEAVLIVAQRWTKQLSAGSYAEMATLTCQELGDRDDLANLFAPIATEFGLNDRENNETLITFSVHEITKEKATVHLTGLHPELGEVHPDGIAAYQMRWEDGGWKWCGKR